METPKKTPAKRGRRFGGKSARKPKEKPITGPLKLTSEAFGRLQPLVAIRAYEMRQRGYVYREIPELLVKEFGIELPGLTTVYDWLDRLDAVSKDFSRFQERMRMDAVAQIEAMKAAWLPRAQGHLQINRRQFNGEGWEVTLDENAFAEQSKAAKVVLDCIATQARLLKLNLADEVAKSGETTLLQLQLWLVDRAAGVERPIDGKVIDSPQLKLESGVELLDA